MNREVLKYSLVGLAIVVAGVAAVLWWTRGAHVHLEGRIGRVRLQPMDERATVAVVDFRATNASDYPFVVRDIKLYLERADGTRVEGMAIAEIDVQRLFQYYPLLGQRYNDTLRMRDRIEPRQTVDRMVAARFEFPEAELERRRRFIVWVQDLDGVISEIREERSGP